MTRARLCAALAAGAMLAVASAAPAFAHTTKTVGTPAVYQLTIGWQHEPTYVGVQNAVQVLVHKTSDGSAVDDLGAIGLQVQVVFSGQKSDPMPLVGAFDPDTGLGTRGEFDAPLIPTRPGDYTFHITGDINGTKVDVSVTSGPSTFDSAKSPADIEFPAKDPTAADLATGFQRLSRRVDVVASSAKSAKDSANTATTLAIVALLVGVVAGGAATAALAQSMRARGQKAVPPEL
jgi:hypothetical protein